MANNVNYQIAENFKEQRRLEYKLQKSKALSLSANLNFGYNAFDEDFNFYRKNQKYYNFSSFGVNLNIPIFSSLPEVQGHNKPRSPLSRPKPNSQNLSKNSVCSMKAQKRVRVLD
jgi:hypothetical protein